MKVPDVNVLLHAVHARAARHGAARAWLEEALSGGELVGFSWSTVTGFLRISTHPRAFSSPLSIQQAWAQIDAWMAAPAAMAVHPTARHLGILRGLLDDAGVGGDLVPDAHLAALAIEHGAEVVSFDRDFGRFAGLRWSMPAAG